MKDIKNNTGAAAMPNQLFHTERPEVIQAIHDVLYTYNLERTGARRRCLVIPENEIADLHAIAVRDTESGDLVSGLVWHFLPDRQVLFVDFLWTDPDRRGGGLGTQLIQAVKMRAAASGCLAVELTTNTFQAPSFYQKHGFRVTHEKNEPTPLCPDNIHYSLRCDLPAR